MKRRSLLLALALICLTVLSAGAGSSWDIGTVPGSPPLGEVTWVAWLGTTNPPTQVLTEDSTNPGSGPDQGYATFGGIRRWVLQASQFNNPAVEAGNPVSILLGGIGNSSGNGWQSSFSWVKTESTSNHNEATVVPSFSACPTMGSAFQNADEMVISWSPSGTYHVYRSTNGSGANNELSNGRYNYVTTVTGTTFTDTSCGSTESRCWHIVVPANLSTNAIVGCHSLESSPTAVTLRTFRAADPAVNWPLIVGLGALAAVVIGGLAVSRRRAARG
jgi:hypothetical protein